MFNPYRILLYPQPALARTTLTRFCFFYTDRMPPRQSSRKAKGAAAERVAKRKAVESSPEPDFTSDEEPQPVKKRKAATKAKVEEEDLAAEEPKVAAAKKPRATKAKGKAKSEDSIPLAERTAIASLKKAMYIGAHVSSAGGMQSSVSRIRLT